MTKDEARKLAAQAVRTHSVTRVATGARAYGETEMRLRTEATDRELDEQRIEADLIRRQKHKKLDDKRSGMARFVARFEDRKAKMGY